MMNLFNQVRLFLIVWSAIMISAIDSVGIRTEGQVELENTNKEAYERVLILTTMSFIGDGVFHLRKKKKTKHPVT